MRYRIAFAGIAALLLLTPLVAMQFTSEVNWTGADFLVFGVMLAAAGLAIELSVRTFSKGGTRTFAIAAVIGAFLAVWALLAVGLD